MAHVYGWWRVVLDREDATKYDILINNFVFFKYIVMDLIYNKCV